MTDRGRTNRWTVRWATAGMVSGAALLGGAGGCDQKGGDTPSAGDPSGSKDESRGKQQAGPGGGQVAGGEFHLPGGGPPIPFAPGSGGLFGDYKDAFVDPVTGTRGGRTGGNSVTPGSTGPGTTGKGGTTRPGTGPGTTSTKPPPPPPPPKPVYKPIPIPPAPKPPPRSVAELTADLKNIDPSMRLKACLALGALKSEARDAVSALENTAKDRDENVRRAAEVALRQIRGNL